MKDELGGIGGSPNAGSPSGTTHDAGGRTTGGRGTRNDSDADAEAVFEDKSHRSQGEAKQFARDEANVDTQPGTPDGGQGRVQQIDRPATG